MLQSRHDLRLRAEACQILLGRMAAIGASLRLTLYPEREQGTPNESLHQTGEP